MDVDVGGQEGRACENVLDEVGAKYWAVSAAEGEGGGVGMIFWLVGGGGWVDAEEKLGFERGRGKLEVENI